MPRPHHDHAIPKGRLDALVDAVFGVAMTLLVISIALPDGFSPKSPDELLNAVIGLQSQFIVYVFTFFVVGLRWLGTTSLARNLEYVSFDYAKLMLLNLFLISCMPFSTMMVGRYDDFFIAVLIYAGNTILSALVSMRLYAMAVRESGHSHHWRDHDVGLPLLIVTALLSIMVGWFSPGHAMIPYLLNVARPLFARLMAQPPARTGR